MNLSDRFAGCILGLALGDAVGYPCEFRSRAHILATFPPRGVTGPVALKDERWGAVPLIMGSGHPAGTFTDDTQMTIAIARGLLEAGPGDIDALMTAIARHFVIWSQSPDNDRAPGATCMTGCANLAQGTPWQQAGVARSKGCGSAMRVAPIGLVYARDRRRLLEVARASSVLTHGHPAALAGAAAAALLVALALDNVPFAQMHAEVASACAGTSPDFEACWAQVPAMLDRDPGHALSDAGLGESWIAEEAVASAMYCVWRANGDFRETVLLAANTDGDSDSIACIAGGIAGARVGVSGLPAEWLAVLERADELRSLADGLFRQAAMV